MRGEHGNTRNTCNSYALKEKMYTTLKITFSLLFLGTLLFAQSPVIFTNPFNTPPVLSVSPSPGTWYVDRYPPTVFEQGTLNGENVLHVGVRIADAFWNRPPANRSAFSNTQGRKFDLGKGNSYRTALIADLYVGADWGTKHRMATLWSSASDSTDATSYFNYFGFRNSTGANPGFYVYGYHNIGDYTLVPVTITYGAWYRLKIELTDTAFNYSINGKVVLSDTTLNGTRYFANLMLQTYNFADSTLAAPNQAFEEYDVYWDNVGAEQSSTVRANPSAVALGSAGKFMVLAGTAVTIGSGTTVSGDVGVSPGTTVTNGGTVNGVIHLQDSSSISGQSSLLTAYNDAAGRTADTTVGSELGGKTLGRGVYVSAAGTFAVTGDLTLSGTDTDIFIFKMATTLTTAAGSKVILTGGVKASNIVWQVGSSATVGGAFAGNILALTAVTQNAGASINGRILALNSFVTLNGTSVLPVEEVAGQIPGAYTLQQNYPNPFNPSTTINYHMPVNGPVSVKVFDVVGREVAELVNGIRTQGIHTVQFDASHLSGGVYFYTMTAGNFTATKKLMLIK